MAPRIPQPICNCHCPEKFPSAMQENVADVRSCSSRWQHRKDGLIPSTSSTTHHGGDVDSEYE
eukprot:m.127077 g.127077  ORF g.127077 m.127077 type:complete len:63 (+) comp15646_c0_seq30:1056-1244(+)